MMMTAEHRRLDRSITEFIHALPGEARLLFLRFAADMRRHLRLEEDLLFPVFEQRAGIAGPVAVMLREHRAIVKLLDTISGALDRDEAGAPASIEQLVALLADHHFKEERILYPKTDLVLDENERARLADQLARP